MRPSRLAIRRRDRVDAVIDAKYVKYVKYLRIPIEVAGHPFEATTAVNLIAPGAVPRRWFRRAEADSLRLTGFTPLEWEDAL